MDNRERNLARDFILHTNRNIFLTGKAGTGKTTLLHEVIETTRKNTVVVAPTGVAAINAGGMTIHSFFQLPPHSFIPSRDHVDPQIATNQRQLAYQQRIRKDRIRMFTELDMLIIDEVSMVRADLLDAIDFSLKRFRKSKEIFGGVQVVVIGDLFQLPPVVKQPAWSVLNTYYVSPFFFEALAWKQCNPIEIELKTIYRQEDKEFINILNNIRNAKKDEYGIRRLNERFNPVPGNSDIITLTTHNAKARRINESELKKLEGSPSFLQATVQGNFSETSFPVNEEIILKEGAQVMFVRNDPDGMFFNGKIGRVSKICSEEILIQCEGNGTPIHLAPVEWKNTRYKINNATNEIETEDIGSFRQYPLKLAWAVTVHKSQGLTFDRVIVDLEDTFAAGQLYVALSRCRTLQGLTLSSRIGNENVLTDPRVLSYHRQMMAFETLENQLELSRLLYNRIQLKEAFTLNSLRIYTDIWIAYVEEKDLPSKADIILLSSDILQTLSKLKETAMAFSRQLDQLFVMEDKSPDGALQVIDRGNKAIGYFTDEIFYQIIVPLEAHYQKFRIKKRTGRYLREAWDLLTKNWNQLYDLYDLSYRAQKIYKGTARHKRPESRQKAGQLKAPKKKQKGDTKKISLQLYKSGKSLIEIAKERELKLGTIESHMVHWLEKKEITLFDLMPEKKAQKIWDHMQKQTDQSLTSMRSQLSFEVSFNELRWVRAWFS